MQNKSAYNSLKLALFDKYFSFLNPRQREAVYTTEGPLLVLAGAGSGKTTVIVNRIANIVLFGRAASETAVPDCAEQLLPIMEHALKNGGMAEVRGVLRQCAVEPAFPYRVLCITFTNKAAREFKERLANTLGEQAQDIWAGTFHSVCVRILRRHIDLLGYKNDFAIYDTDDTKKLVTEIIKELGIPESTLPPKAAMNAISRAKERDTDADEAFKEAGFDRRAQLIARVYEKYQKRLKEANALDFDDIIMLTNRLFESHKDVLNRYREQFEYILVDEYQDTNPSQSHLVALLSGRKRNVCVVGDDDQSIYSFRGATVENILGFDREYSGARIIRLEQNYRSTGNILKAANGIIENNRSRKGKELFTEAGDGEKVHVKRVYTQADEAQFICDTIEKKVALGAKYSDFAVLYRVNALSNSLETALVKNKIPYKIFGGIRFFERREVKDILAYLAVIANTADTVRLRRIINVPKRAIGDATVEKVAEIAGRLNLPMFSVIERADEFKELARASAKLLAFAGLINSLRAFASEHTVSETVARVIEESGYRVMLAEEDDGGREREENVLELVSSAALFEETSESSTLADFLNELALVSDLDNYETDSDTVVLMTVHSAKGLEFPTVFIPGFEEGLFPSSQSANDGEKGLEEERRLAYVAVTRAKNELYLIHTQTRMLYGRTEMRAISRFGKEIPASACDVKAVAGTSGGYASARQASYSEEDTKSRNNYLNNVRASYAKAESAAALPVGCRVMHPMFGAGEIVAAQPMGGDVLYEIEFDNGSIKRLMGNFAKLKKL